MGPLPKGAGACSDLVKSMDSIRGLEPTKATKMGLELKRLHPILLGRETRPEATCAWWPHHPEKEQEQRAETPAWVVPLPFCYWWLLVLSSPSDPAG